MPTEPRLMGPATPTRIAVVPPLSAARWLLLAVIAAGVYFFHGFVVPVLAALVIATLVWSLGEIIGYPSLFFAYPAQAGPPALRGRYLGASNALYGLGSAVGPFIGVMIWNRYEEGLWLGCGVVGLLAAAAAWGGVRPPRATEKNEDRAENEGKGIGDSGTADAEIRTGT